MMKSNLALIQSPPPEFSSSVPLILIHDGGGTTFSYHCLGSLNRPVYGISNPRFYSGRPWKGGIPEMAKVYADLVRLVVGKGRVLLGGWSLGGLVALEVAANLASSLHIDIVGIVMIDSIYPGGFRSQRANENVVPPRPLYTEKCKPEMKMLIQRSMKLSTQMIEGWELPLWGSKSDGDVSTNDNGGGNRSYQESHSWRSSRSGLAGSRVLAPPPVVLLRCREFVPVLSADGGAKSRVDVSRHDEKLGWDDCDADLVKLVFEISGHHFNVFAEENIGKTTEQLALACGMLERLDFYF